jgi:LPPG:FO 2-phospho-L-lactate transferase
MKVVALSGGVGGARLVDGLAACLGPNELTVVVNTGDDFRHCGLWICPDLDTVMYTLSGRAPVARGWGLAEENFLVMDHIKKLNGPDWFLLSDQDLATHLTRTDALDKGQSLSAVTAHLMQRHDVHVRVLPMCEEPAPTMLRCKEDILSFQDWFVAQRTTPPVHEVIFPIKAPATEGVCTAIRDADLVVMTPSNPYLSMDPILNTEGLGNALAARRGPCIGVSPIVNGAAIKGPLAALIPTLAQRPPSADAIIDHYGALVDAWVVEEGDSVAYEGPVLATQTIMTNRARRKGLGRAVLDWAARLMSGT